MNPFENSDLHYLKTCKALIEKKLSWSDSTTWKQRDFLNLISLIEKESGISLSLSTIKRLWSKDYGRTPQKSTLDALAVFIGFKDWLDFKSINFQQLERLQAVWANPNQIDRSSAKYQKVYDEIVMKYYSEPSIYHFLGYETIVYLGEMLHKHGKYLQNATVTEDFTGDLGIRYQFGLERDNQVVPLISLDDLELRIFTTRK